MKSAYKWRLDTKNFSYIIDDNGGEPFIGEATSLEENEIKVLSSSLDKNEYKNRFETMVKMVEEAGFNVHFLKWNHYYNIDSESCVANGNCASSQALAAIVNSVKEGDEPDVDVDIVNNTLMFDFTFPKGAKSNGMQMIYKRAAIGETVENPITEYGIDIKSDEYQEVGIYENTTFIPKGWNEKPIQTDDTINDIWVAQRNYSNGAWDGYSNPVIWSKRGSNVDIDIDELIKNNIYIKVLYATSDDDTYPAYNPLSINPGSLWSLKPNYDRNKTTWEISAYFTHDGEFAEVEYKLENGEVEKVYGWSTPVLISGRDGINGTIPNYNRTFYKMSETKPEKPIATEINELANDGWVDVPSISGQWWQCVALISGEDNSILKFGDVLQLNGRDGIDGKDGVASYHFELTNDTEQVYVDEENKVKVEQKLTTCLLLFEGTKRLEIEKDKVEVALINGEISNVPFEIVIEDDIEVTEYGESLQSVNVNIILPIDLIVKTDRLSFEISYKNTIKKNFTVVRLNSSYDYDIFVNHSYIKYNTFGITDVDEIDIKIFEREIGNNSSVRVIEVKDLPFDFTFTCEVDGIEIENSNAITSLSGMNIPKNRAVLKLYKYYGTDSEVLYDQVNIETVRDGKDGKGSYHLELTNDMDQVYVDEFNYTREAQTVSTTISLFDGGDKISIENGDIFVILYDEPVEFEVKEVKDDDGFKSVKISLAWDKNEKIEDKELPYSINVKGIITKIFKVNRINSIYDYDLILSQTYVKYDSSNNIVDDNITIQVSRKEFGFGSTSSIISSYEELESNGLTIKYVKDDIEITNFSTLEIEGDNLPKSRGVVSLFKDNVLFDRVNIEALRDGADGVSPYYTDLSSDMDQLYVNSDNKTFTKQTISTNLSLFEGVNLKEINAEEVKVSSSNDIDGYSVEIKQNGTTSVDINITFEKDLVITEDKIIFDIAWNDIIQRKLIINIINSRYDYDLMVSNTVVKYKMGESTVDDITVRVMEKEIGNNNSTKILDITELPTTLKVVFIIDGNEIDGITSISGSNIPNNYAIVQLYANYGDVNSILYDQVNIEVISDGIDGKGSYNLELSNDMDQVYVDENYKVIGEQTISTTATLFSELDKIDLTLDDVIVRFESDINESEVNITKDRIVDENGLGEIKIDIKFNENSVINNGKLLFNIEVKKVIRKTFIVSRVNSRYDYDLNVFPTYVKYDKSGKCDITEINVSVLQKEVGYGTSSLEIKNISTLNDFGFTLFYTKDGDKKVINELPVKEIPTTSGLIELYRDNNLIDKVLINAISDGIDGEGSYHIELSNDAEQVYINDEGVVEVSQTAETTITLFNGLNKVEVKNSDITISLNGSLLSSEKYTIESNSLEKRTSLKIFYSENEKITDNKLRYSINIKNVGVKEFVVVVLNDTCDYDLNVFPSYLRKDKNGELAIKSITVGVTKRVNGYNTSVEEITFDAFSKEGLTVEYDIDNTVVGAILNSEYITLNDVNSRVVVRLRKNGILYDKANVELVTDGADGVGAYHLELTNDMDQVYVDGNNKVIDTITVNTNVELYEGNKKIDLVKGINELIVTNIPQNSITYNNGIATINLTFNKGEVINSALLKYSISLQKYNVKETFHVVRVNSITDYDLIVTPTLIKYDSDGIISDTSKIEVSIFEKVIGVDSESKETTLLPIGYTVQYKIDETTKVLTSSTENSVVNLSNIPFELPKYGSNAVLSLYNNYGSSSEMLFDSVTVNTIKDGVDGEDGLNGIPGAQGPKGDKGEDGIGISKVEEFYLLSNSSTGITTATTGWQKTLQTTTLEKRYLWNYEKITYSNGATTSSTPQVIGMYSEDGRGIKSITEYYQRSESNSIIPTSWLTTPPELTTTYKYLWNYELVEYTDSTTSKTTEVVIGVYGDKGDKGDKGDNGKDGIQGPIGEKGDNGIAGIPGSSLEALYTIGSETQYDNNGWKDDISALTPYGDYAYIWCKQGKKTYAQKYDSSGNPISGSFSETITYGKPFRMQGVNGVNGKDGRGQILYPAGIYDENVRYNTTKDSAPYVLDTLTGKYYVLNKVTGEYYDGVKFDGWLGSEQNYSPSNDKTNTWVEFEHFDAVYAKVGIIANGMVGSAVFNGDYMFSQHGVDENGNSTTDYELFNPESPFDKNSEFKPAYCVNLRTGQVWQGNGEIYFQEYGEMPEIYYDSSNSVSGYGRIGSLLIADNGIKFLTKNDNGGYQLSTHLIGFNSDGTIYNYEDDSDYVYWMLDRNGNCEFAGGKIKFNSDGSGELADGKISWDKDGNLSLPPTVFFTAKKKEGDWFEQKIDYEYMIYSNGKIDNEEHVVKIGTSEYLCGDEECIGDGSGIEYFDTVKTSMLPIHEEGYFELYKSSRYAFLNLDGVLSARLDLNEYGEFVPFKRFYQDIDNSFYLYIDSDVSVKVANGTYDEKYSDWSAVNWRGDSCEITLYVKNEDTYSDHEWEITCYNCEIILNDDTCIKKVGENTYRFVLEHQYENNEDYHETSTNITFRTTSSDSIWDIQEIR